MGQIFLVRHGQASFGAADYDQLSPAGVEQSRLLGAWLGSAGQRFGRVVTGSLKRHRQTAEACVGALPEAARPAGDWHTDPGFDEYDHEEVLVRHRPEFGDPIAAKDFLGRDPNPKRAFQRVFAEAMARWMGGQHDADYRESWGMFRARCLAALGRVVGTAGAAQSAIVFTSGGPIAAICQDLLGVADRKAAELNFSLVNSAVTKLLYNSEGRVSLSYLNNFAHLEQTGQARSITYR
ncbi:MAG: histidine phosphatase family protein [Gammaproteobacteria bacterium]